MAAKKNLKNKLDQHNKEIKSSSELNDRLAADIPETGQEAQEGLYTDSVEAADTLESTGDTTQWQRQNSAESETDAAVEDDMVAHPEAADTDRLHSDIPETRREAEEAVRVDNVEADIDIEATGDVTEWQDAGAEEAETDAAVEVTETKPKRHVKDDLPDYLL